MEQTAVEWFADRIKHGGLVSKKQFNELLKQAKEMFEEQITNCFDHGDLVGRASVIREINPNDKVVLKYPEISAEQYYKETYKSE